MRGLGDLEASVMDRLWAWEHPATVREVLDDLRRDRDLAYTTVMTVLDNLHRKGWLTRELDGRAYRYRPVASRQEYFDAAEDIYGNFRDRANAIRRACGSEPEV